MTQKEFDLQMNEFRRAESEEKFPIDTELAQLTQKRRYLGQQIVSLNLQVGGVRMRIAELVAQRKAIGHKYWEQKRAFILQNPKQETACGCV